MGSASERLSGLGVAVGDHLPLVVARLGRAEFRLLLADLRRHRLLDGRRADLRAARAELDGDRPADGGHLGARRRRRKERGAAVGYRRLARREDGAARASADASAAAEAVLRILASRAVLAALAPACA